MADLDSNGPASGGAPGSAASSAPGPTPGPTPGPKLAHATKRALRWNALLSIVLLGLIVVFANLLAGRHLRIR
ncbi:MAG: hypothetical protein ACI80K_004820, partial [Paracoccaceae bacterium]